MDTTDAIDPTEVMDAAASWMQPLRWNCSLTRAWAWHSRPAPMSWPGSWSPGR